MAEDTKQSFYHHHNAIDMVIALHRYESINTQQEVAGLAVRYGPPVVNGRIQTEEVNLHAATGIYAPRESFPAEVTPTVLLEDAIAELYRVKGIGPKGETGKVKTSAERRC